MILWFQKNKGYSSKDQLFQEVLSVWKQGYSKYIIKYKKDYYHLLQCLNITCFNNKICH